MIQDKDIIRTISDWKTQNEEGHVFITSNLTKSTKEIVRRAKSYYNNVSKDNFKDADVIFYPYTKTVIDSMAANLDFDTKDILITSRQENTNNLVTLTKELLDINLNKYNFGQTLNEMMINYCRDGVVVSRTTEENGHPQTEVIDIENLVFDSNTNKPQKFLERILKPKGLLPKEWKVDETDNSVFPDVGMKDKKSVELWRFEGMCPMSWITKNESQTDQKWMVLFLTGLRNGQTPKIHEIKILGDSLMDSSYDFAQYTPSNASFVGVGLGEVCFGIQEYLNLVINNRKNKSNVSAKGIYLVRKGSGLTPDMLENISNGGAIPVTNLTTDIRSLETPQTGNDNFLEETRLLDAGQRLTGITPVSQGLQDKSGATLGEVNLTAGFSNVRFKFQRQNFAFMVQRIIRRWMEIILKNMNTEELVAISDEKMRRSLAQDASKIEMLALLKRNLNTVGIKGVLATIEQNPQESFFDKHFQKNGFILLKSSLKDLDYAVKISLTNENTNSDTLTKNLIQLLQLAPTVPGLDTAAIVEATYKALGISLTSLKGDTKQPVQQPMTVTQ